MLLQHEVDDTAGETIDDGCATCDAIVAAGGDCVEFLETELELPAA